ncbi:hypothetical protein [Bradyrhizobium sp. 33ap4]|uniref:hypothetical protein n=1 Tax=Bradyrhizobium sp. 33ap4 TaxID=3061630 RepID=UPI00292FEEDE|nr:hypothetical protein [Bradyrhizobium sp. 33ap4]
MIAVASAQLLNAQRLWKTPLDRSDIGVTFSPRLIDRPTTNGELTLAPQQRQKSAFMRTYTPSYCWTERDLAASCGLAFTIPALVQLMHAQCGEQSKMAKLPKLGPHAQLLGRLALSRLC